MNTSAKKWLHVSLGALFLAGAPICIYLDFTSAYRFEAEGTITEAAWNTKNHQTSLFRIRANDGTEKVLQHPQVILTADQIKKGDQFSKRPRSYYCIINGIKVRCVK